VALHRGRHSTPRHHPLRLAVAVAAVITAVVLLQMSRSIPTPVVRAATLASTTSTVSGASPALPWPKTGQAAVAVPGRGLLIQSGPESPVPIASLTKIMTAYVVLTDHPLAPDAQGPEVAIDQADHDEALDDDYDGATEVPVLAGESLSERQLLNGLMVHSANNFADVLADWDAGSVPAFVARMNSTAAGLGMRSTHYVDANGLDAHSVSTAADQLRLAMVAMANPTFAGVVGQTSITLPIAGLIPNFVSSIGTDGIVGVKSGFTQAAMGCLVMAALRPVSGRNVTVLAATTGQPGDDPLGAANLTDIGLVDAVGRDLRESPVLASHTEAAMVTTPWLDRAVPAETTRGVTLLAWPGDEVRLSFVPDRLVAGSRAGTMAGHVIVSDGTEKVTVAVRTTAPVTKAPLSWRLARG
jgi:serine-type D-Ala-D-Ala carboxypeptidase (penicillin-binding protein 5/6)